MDAHEDKIGITSSATEGDHTRAADSAAPRSRLVERVFIVAVIATIAIGLVVLLGWLLDVELLKRIRADWPTMKTNAAVALLLTGVSLLLLRGDQPSGTRVIAAQALATIVTVLGALTVAQDVFGWNLGIDELLIEEPAPPPFTISPNRMAPVTAVGFTFFGIALLLRKASAVARRVSDWLAIAVATGGYMALLGYLYGEPYTLWIPRTTAMALHTALSLIFLSIALLCLHPRSGVVGILMSKGAGSHVARRLIPAAVLIPATLGLLRLMGEKAGLYDTPFGTASLVAATSLLFACVAWWSAAALNQLDAHRLAAMRRTMEESDAREVERRRLRAVLDVLPVGVFLANASGRIHDVNEAAKAIWGESTPFVGSISEYERFRAWWTGTGKEVKAEEWGMARSITRGEVCLAEEIDIEPFDGDRKTILNYSAPIVAERGAIAGGVAVNVDITERKRAELELTGLRNELEERVRRRTAELAAANAELEAFSYSVSHDLRAPLRWVDGFTQALAEDYAQKLDETGRDYIRQIRESVQRMSELIDALLRLSRITRVSLERADVDLSLLAREIAAELAAAEPQRRATWEIADELRAEADPKLVRVVLENLLRNAWKFSRTREVARIQVGLKEQGGERVYFVHDNGVGFDMTYVDKLFRSFERLHRAEEFEGTGVGLALVRRVIQRHGGRAWAEGRLNEGATFYFTLGPSQEQA